MKTAGRWPWKSESAKKCVTAYLPNLVALKMDGAQTFHLFWALLKFQHLKRSRKACGALFYCKRFGSKGERELASTALQC